MKKHLLAILMIILISGCTEKVSEELSSSASSSTTSVAPTVVDPYFMKIINDKSANLSHFLHLAGDKQSECEFSFSSVPLALTYDKSDKSLAVDCMLEVEESDLHYQGVDFTLNVSEGMCEYISVRPYTYWNFQPGITSKVIYTVECENDGCSANLCGKTFATFVDGDVSGTIEVGEISNAISDPSAISCYFDHSQYPSRYNYLGDTTLPNCDEGSIRTVTIQIPGVPTDNNCGGVVTNDLDLFPATTLSDISVSTNDCGGNIRNCLAGPGEDFDVDYQTEVGVVLYNQDLEEINRAYNITAPQNTDKITNISIANFSRSCAAADNSGVVIDFDGTAGRVNDTTQGDAITNLVFSSQFFAGYLTESRIKPASLTDLTTGNFAITNASGNYISNYYNNGVDYNGDTQIDAYVLATSPFRGYGNLAHPYYKFSCLDKAFDIKAQIRLFIRDWDRSFDEDSLSLDIVSDYYTASPTAIMDNGDDHDLFDNSEEWNDFWDLDDFFMSEYDGVEGVQYMVYDTNGRFTHTDTQITDFTLFHGTDVTPANYMTVPVAGTKLIDNRCQDMSSPYDWRNFPSGL